MCCIEFAYILSYRTPYAVMSYSVMLYCNRNNVLSYSVTLYRNQNSIVSYPNADVSYPVAMHRSLYAVVSNSVTWYRNLNDIVSYPVNVSRNVNDVLSGAPNENIVQNHLNIWKKLICKCRRTLLKLNFKWPYPSWKRKIKFCRCLFTSSIKFFFFRWHLAKATTS